MSEQNKFHAGERSVQDRAGEAAVAQRNVAVLSDTVIGGARPFIAKQFMVALASVDAAGRVWSSLVFGKPGFLHTADGSTIEMAVSGRERDADEPLWANLTEGADLGMLFIELGTRRRYRVNGTVARLDDAGVQLRIREAYPNCPKYIQRRELRQLGGPRLPVASASGTVLRGTVEQIVRQADTVFVASHHPDAGADASHRGGPAGFVKVVDDTTLRIPDFHGNSLFNTLGNFAIDPRAGLCIPDFDGGQLLQLTGSATLQWDQDDPAQETGGTARFWEFKVEQWVLRDTPQALAWEYLDASPFNPRGLA